MDQNINYKISEKECLNSNSVDDDATNDLDGVLNEFEQIELNYTYNNYSNDDELYTSMIDYEKNYTVKQLQLIAEYYGLKIKKMKKEDLICEILLFEEKNENTKIVFQRMEFWYYMKELKNDKFMKKFIFGF